MRGGRYDRVFMINSAPHAQGVPLVVRVREAGCYAECWAGSPALAGSCRRASARYRIGSLGVYASTRHPTGRLSLAKQCADSEVPRISHCGRLWTAKSCGGRRRKARDARLAETESAYLASADVRWCRSTTIKAVDFAAIPSCRRLPMSADIC
jgi:hypothetical protein